MQMLIDGSPNQLRELYLSCPVFDGTIPATSAVTLSRLSQLEKLSLSLVTEGALSAGREHIDLAGLSKLKELRLDLGDNGQRGALAFVSGLDLRGCPNLASIRIACGPPNYASHQFATEFLPTTRKTIEFEYELYDAAGDEDFCPDQLQSYFTAWTRSCDAAGKKAAFHLSSSLPESAHPRSTWG